MLLKKRKNSLLILQRFTLKHIFKIFINSKTRIFKKQPAQKKNKK